MFCNEDNKIITSDDDEDDCVSDQPILGSEYTSNEGECPDSNYISSEGKRPAENSEQHLDPDEDSNNTDKPKLSLANFSYMRDINSREFFTQQHNDPHGGIRGLAIRAHLGCNDLTRLATFSEADLLFDMTDSLVKKNTSRQHHHLKYVRNWLELTTPGLRTST